MPEEESKKPGKSEMARDMNGHIHEYLRVWRQVHRWDESAGEWVRLDEPPNKVLEDLTEHQKYQMWISIVNEGYEVYFKNVQIRAKNDNEDRIVFYEIDEDNELESYKRENVIDRKSSPIYHDILLPRRDRTNWRDRTPWFKIPFEVKEGPDAKDAVIAGLGIYAEGVPQGHDWSRDVRFDLD